MMLRTQGIRHRTEYDSCLVLAARVLVAGRVLGVCWVVFAFCGTGEKCLINCFGNVF
jgi:hypothetical protein